MATGGEGDGGTNWDSSTKTYTSPYVKLDNQHKFAVWHKGLKSGALWQPRGAGGGREVQKGGGIRIPMADSCWYMAETYTIL